jgi:hypothetical protein
MQCSQLLVSEHNRLGMRTSLGIVFRQNIHAAVLFLNLMHSVFIRTLINAFTTH